MATTSVSVTKNKRPSKKGRLCGLLLLSEAVRGVAVAAGLARAHAHDVAVNSARNAVLHLDVHLGEAVLIIHAGDSASLEDITERCLLDNVAHHEALDGLILGDAATAVRATNGLGVTATVLGTAIIPSLLGHAGQDRAVKNSGLDPWAKARTLR
eukprot:Mycagemm_TRINITY_DN3308_c0_g1::TRINITY_DN3308_c0_g1_i1::g.1415::m.1415 type:complete len:155 gc:universal TRINITY_DN3308_c0_g1_i1:484-20(-)